MFFLGKGATVNALPVGTVLTIPAAGSSKKVYCDLLYLYQNIGQPNS